jgi:hypothetical protein
MIGTLARWPASHNQCASPRSQFDQPLDFGIVFRRRSFWHNTGIRNLQDVLENELGLNLAGWRLRAAYDVSTDGLTIVGDGINPEGNVEGWIAVIPEPSTHLLLGVGLLGLTIHHNRRRTRLSRTIASL